LFHFNVNLKYILNYIPIYYLLKKKQGKRKDMIINMSIFSFEVILQDGRFYVPGLSESYLNKEIEKLEVIKYFSFFYI